MSTSTSNVSPKATIPKCTPKQKHPAPSNKSNQEQISQIQAALDANLNLQNELIQSIEAIAFKKRSNRLKVVQLLQKLSSSQSKNLERHGEEEEQEKLNDKFYLDMYKNRLEHNDRTRREGPNATSQSYNLPINPLLYKKKWTYNEKRKWNLRYFQDADLSIPKPNNDVAKRKIMRGKDCPHYTTDIKWNKDELISLRMAVHQVLKQMNTQCNHIVSESQITFDQVAQIHNTEMTAKRWSKTKNKSLHYPRTAIQCRIMYFNHASLKINKSKFTKTESLQIVKWVHQYKDFPPWDKVASSLQSNRTPWQCFQYYQTSINPSIPCKEWTPEEDELLLKYIAAKGPHYVVNITNCEDISKTLFPDRASKQLYIRANYTLMNPNLTTGLWNMEQERKLALCMKVYKNEKRPLAKVALHFPNKAPKRVCEKWDRLNPIFDRETPFSKEEDVLLLQSVNELLAKKGSNENSSSAWTIGEIRHIFPSRTSNSIFSRWIKLASKEQLVNKYSCILKQKAGGRKGTVGSSSEGALFSPDDFIIRMKKEE